MHDELKTQISNLFDQASHHPNEPDLFGPDDYAETVLALPEIAEALQAKQKLDKVEELLLEERKFSVEYGEPGWFPNWIYKVLEIIR